MIIVLKRFLFAVSRQVLLNVHSTGLQSTRMRFYSLFRDRCFSTEPPVATSLSRELVSIRCFATGASQLLNYERTDVITFLFAVSRQVLLNKSASPRRDA